MDGIDYLAIGHVCRDLTPEGPRPGGSVTFSALTARAFGLRVGIVTSAPSRDDPLLRPLEAVPASVIPAARYTTFENTYTLHGRIQRILGRASPLHLSHVPDGWREAGIVHLAPVADEIDPAIIASFPRALIGVTPQGWMRAWDDAGYVSFKPWQSASYVLAKASAVVLSIDDIQGDEQLAQAYASQAALLVVTRGAQGCTLFARGERADILTTPLTEGDPTGAGDIFAAAFFACLYRSPDALAAARVATRLATASVARVGLEGIPSAATVQTALIE